MPALLLDTNVVLRSDQHRKHEVSRAATTLIDAAAANGEAALSSITFLEVATLAERGRISVDAEELYRYVIQNGIRVIPLDARMAMRAGRLSGEGYAGRDPADRMIVATAILAGCDLITMDREVIDWNGPLRVIDARA
ncbi:MAG: type II toxin-antitoxin system VapC family toxin [Acidimicrobiia bacterium]|nr:type II toxin-antitoxin system VapC family toxin [Acidimicrobiia bacterium]MYF82760.1 type II toxin-antitoxin system VapC family toxin [Acidimicrobiia bacterium]